MTIDGGGPEAQRALELLGSVDDERGRNLLGSLLKGANGAAISAVAKGLTAPQCAQYLPDLRKAALDPAVEPKIEIVAALGRAGTPEAAQALADVADQSSDLLAGIAFGSLERLGIVAEPVLERQLATSQSAKTRETAAHVLRRIGATGAGGAYRNALSDNDSKVRFAAALGLAQLGFPDGAPALELAAKGNNVDYQVEAITALAMLGRSGAVERLKTLARSPSETTRGKTVWAIARSGSPKLRDIAYDLKLEENPRFKTMLVEKLMDPNNARDLRVLRSAVSDENEMLALTAARRLIGTSSEDVAASAVSRGLRSKSEHVRLFALNVASESTAMSNDLATRISDSDPVVRAAAISAVATRHQTERFSEIQPNLTSTSPDVSLSAARALFSLDRNRARRLFESNLDSNVDHVRLYSAALLLAQGK
jgi:HEAT repeat protein